MAAMHAQLDLPLGASIRNSWFDSMQILFPRPRSGDPVILVDVDDSSLMREGQWPWPRAVMAKLVNAIQAQQPAAIGIDMLFSEPDRFSPSRLKAQGILPPSLELPNLPDYDQLFATAIESAPVVLAVAGLESRTLRRRTSLSAPPIRIRGAQKEPIGPVHADAVVSIDLLAQAATGQGAINHFAIGGGVLRRVPGVIRVEDQMVPGFAVELLRVATGVSILDILISDNGGSELGLGPLRIPLDAEGAWRLHFSAPEARLQVSASDVLRHQIPNDLMQGRIVIIGASAAGLGDTVRSPLGQMLGMEVHAEALENALASRLLTRPYWSQWAETGALFAFGLLVVLVVPVIGSGWAALLFPACIVLALAGSVGLFLSAGLMVDPMPAVIGVAILFPAALMLSLENAQRLRRVLRQELVGAKQSQARMLGELDAARRIQVGMLPQPSALIESDPRVDVAALMEPARTVGGDFYDFFPIADDKLFFVVGDVSGKGLPASLFMALSKALIKNVAMSGQTDPGKILSQAATVMGYENPEALFVSAVVAVLDLQSGALAWCSAGHESPFLTPPDKALSQRLQGRGGPALCMVDGFEFQAEQVKLRAGDSLCLISDGVTEAHNSAGDFYGSARLCQQLQRTAARAAADQISALKTDVRRFCGDAELPDDLTALIVCWKGAAGA